LIDLCRSLHIPYNPKGARTFTRYLALLLRYVLQPGGIMIIKQYSTFLTALVLGFGLISCSQDKDIQYQDDKFEPEPLRLERNDNSLTVIDNLVSMGLNDKLTFNNPTEIDSQQITHLELTTSCQEQFSNEKIVHQSQWPNPTEVHLLNMIPPRVLVKKSTENIFCDIEYTFTNKNNSTSTRTVKNIKFNNDEKFTNLPANHLFASTDDINWSTQQNTSIDLEDRTGGLLHCDDIDITINPTTPQSLLKDLIPQEQIQQAEPKSLHQSCRVAFSIHKNIVL